MASQATCADEHNVPLSSSTSINDNNKDIKAQQKASYVAQNRLKLSKMLQLHGYSACREALIILEDHFTSSTKYDSMEDFINLLNRVVTFDIESSTSIIDSDTAYTIVKELKNKTSQQVVDLDNIQIGDLLPTDLTVRIKNVQYDHIQPDNNSKTTPNLSANNEEKSHNEFNIHYNFLFKKLISLPIFQGDFQLTKLSSLTASSQPSIRCICFGLLIKDISKIDGYLLIDSSGRVPVRITPDTSYRNKIAYLNCIVLVEGVYVNPDDILYAANIGLPPILLDPIMDKSLASRDEKLVVILKELYLDEDDVCKMIDLLFTGYNSMEDPPALFILIGDFTRNQCDLSEYKNLMKKFIRILRTCDNLKDSHFVLIPGQKDTTKPEVVDKNQQLNHSHHRIVNTSKTNKMPKAPLTKEQIPINLLEIANFKNVHLATNPAHIYLGERLISVVCHSYIKELRKHLLHDLSDHKEELFEIIKQIIMSNAHLATGLDKTYHSSLNLWHRPDLLILADTEATGNRYDFNLSEEHDTSFMTVPSFSKQSYQFKVYYLKTGQIDDSQVSSDVLVSDDEEVVQLIEQENSEID